MAANNIFSSLRYRKLQPQRRGAEATALAKAAHGMALARIAGFLAVASGVG